MVYQGANLISFKTCLERSFRRLKMDVFDTLICIISFLLEIVNEFEILMTPMDGDVCFIIDHLCYGILKNIFQMSLRISFWVFFFFSFRYTIAKGLAMCWLGGMITTQKPYILNNNSHEFHTFWVVIMPNMPK